MQNGMFCWLENLGINSLFTEWKGGYSTSLITVLSKNRNVISTVMAKCIYPALLSRISNKQHPPKTLLPKSCLTLGFWLSYLNSVNRLGGWGEGRRNGDASVYEYVSKCVYDSLQPWKRLVHAGTLNKRTSIPNVLKVLRTALGTQ